METEIARGEVELLVIGWIIGDVHLAIDACDGAIFLKHHCCIVVQACCTTLKERGDDHHAKLLGKFTIEFGRGARDRFCKVEVVDILHLTEIQGVVKLLQYDQFRPAFGKVGNTFRQAQNVLMRVCTIGLL